MRHEEPVTGLNVDVLDDDAWLRSYLERAGWGLGRVPDAGERAALRDLRSLLGALADAFRTEGALAPGAFEVLNCLLSGAPIVRRVEAGPGGPTLSTVPAADGIAAVLGEIVASFVALVVTGEPGRLKRCANPDCGWMVYDESRNRSRRWCDAADCGNLVNVRVHRQRLREHVGARRVDRS